MHAQGLKRRLGSYRLEKPHKITSKTMKIIDFQAKSMVFHWFPGQNLFSAADTLTAGQFAPEGGFLGRVLPVCNGCGVKWHLYGTFCHLLFFQKQGNIVMVHFAKKLLKNRVPENGLTHRRRSFFQDLLKILLSKRRMVSAFEAGADAAR